MDVANWVSTAVAALAAVAAWLAVFVARRHAARSESHAARSADAAERSAATAEMQLERERQVRWQWKHEGSSSPMHRLINCGELPAYDVEVWHPAIAEQGHPLKFDVIEGHDFERVRILRYWGARKHDVKVIWSRERGGRKETPWRHPL
jgi:hypothetical protein